MLRAIRAVMRKELIQTFRDPRMLMVLVMAPMLQVVLLGFAVNFDLKDQPIIIVDRDRSPESREVVRVISHHESFKVLAVLQSDVEADAAIWRGAAAISLHIPKGYGKDLAAGKASLILMLDGSDSNTAVRSGQELTQITGNQAVTLQRATLEKALAASGLSAASIIPQIVVEPRAWFNPQLKTSLFLVPGVLALVLLVITIMLTSMGLTREKELGTLEQVMVSPLRPIELIIGKTLPFAVMGLFDMTLVLSLAVLIFALPVRGSIPAIYLCGSIFLMTTLGMGLFISTISNTQQQAMLNTFFFMFPAIMLSGYFFPVEHMPRLVQYLTMINPLRYFITLARGLCIKGASLTDLYEPLVALTVLGLLVFGGAAWRFKKRIA